MGLTLLLFVRNLLNEPGRKRLLDRLGKYHEDCARCSFKLQLPCGNYYTVMNLLWLLYKMASRKQKKDITLIHSLRGKQTKLYCF